MNNKRIKKTFSIVLFSFLKKEAIGLRKTRELFYPKQRFLEVKKAWQEKQKSLFLIKFTKWLICYLIYWVVPGWYIFAFFRIFLKKRLWQFTILKIQFRISEHRLAVRIQSNKKTRLHHLITVFSLLPFFLGFCNFLNENPQIKNTIIQYTLPAFQRPTESLNWDTLNLFSENKKDFLTLKEVENVNWSKHSVLLTKSFNTDFFIKQLVLPCLKTGNFRQFLHTFYLNLDEIPFKLDNLNSFPLDANFNNLVDTQVISQDNMENENFTQDNMENENFFQCEQKLTKTSLLPSQEENFRNIINNKTIIDVEKTHYREIITPTLFSDISENESSYQKQIPFVLTPADTSIDKIKTSIYWKIIRYTKKINIHDTGVQRALAELTNEIERKDREDYRSALGLGEVARLKEEKIQQKMTKKAKERMAKKAKEKKKQKVKDKKQGEGYSDEEYDKEEKEQYKEEEKEQYEKEQYKEEYEEESEKESEEENKELSDEEENKEYEEKDDIKSKGNKVENNVESVKNKDENKMENLIKLKEDKVEKKVENNVNVEEKEEKEEKEEHEVIKIIKEIIKIQDKIVKDIIDRDPDVDVDVDAIEKEAVKIGNMFYQNDCDITKLDIDNIYGINIDDVINVTMLKKSYVMDYMIPPTKEVISILEKAIIEQNYCIPRRMSGFLYPDMNLKEVKIFLIHNIFAYFQKIFGICSTIQNSLKINFPTHPLFINNYVFKNQSVPKNIIKPKIIMFEDLNILKNSLKNRLKIKLGLKVKNKLRFKAIPINKLSILDLDTYSSFADLDIYPSIKYWVKKLLKEGITDEEKEKERAEEERKRRLKGIKYKESDEYYYYEYKEDNEEEDNEEDNEEEDNEEKEKEKGEDYDNNEIDKDLQELLMAPTESSRLWFENYLSPRNPLTSYSAISRYAGFHFLENEDNFVDFYNLHKYKYKFPKSNLLMPRRLAVTFPHLSLEEWQQISNEMEEFNKSKKKINDNSYGYYEEIEENEEDKDKDKKKKNDEDNENDEPDEYQIKKSCHYSNKNRKFIFDYYRINEIPIPLIEIDISSSSKKPYVNIDFELDPTIDYNYSPYIFSTADDNNSKYDYPYNALNLSSSLFRTEDERLLKKGIKSFYFKKKRGQKHNFFKTLLNLLMKKDKKKNENIDNQSFRESFIEYYTSDSWLIFLIVCSRFGFIILLIKTFEDAIVFLFKQFSWFLASILVALLSKVGREAQSQTLKQTAALLTDRSPKGYKIVSRKIKQFKDLAGIHSLFSEIVDIVDFLRVSKYVFFVPNLKNVRGCLLVGPPGTGKTALVQALASEAEVPIVVLSGNSLRVSSESIALKLKLVFIEARLIAPCIIFIDEIDTLAQNREQIKNKESISTEDNLISIEKSQTSFFNKKEQIYDIKKTERFYEEFKEEENRHFTKTDTRVVKVQIQAAKNIAKKLAYDQMIKNEKIASLLQLLVELDGIKTKNRKIVVIGATNRLESMDPAVFRPGRFNRIIELGLPNDEKRIEIFKFYTRILGCDLNISWDTSLFSKPNINSEKTISNYNLIEENDRLWEYLSKRTKGFSAADIASIMNHSCIQAILNNSKHTLKTIEYGIDLITIAEKEKPSKKITPLYINRIAYYQAGKLLLSTVLEDQPPIIVSNLWPRRHNKRFLQILSNFQKYFIKNADRSKLEQLIVSCYGGKAAEVLFLQKYPVNISGFGFEDLNLAFVLICLLIEKWYCYSKSTLVTQLTQIFNQIFEKKNYDIFNLLVCKEITKPIELYPYLFFLKLNRPKIFSPFCQEINWWLEEIAKILKLSQLSFSYWYRFYIPNITKYNVEWCPPDQFYSSKLVNKKINNNSLVTWNDLHNIIRDYQVHAFILESFNKALFLVDTNREYLDRLAFEFIKRETLRQPEIEKLASMFISVQKTKFFDTHQIMQNSDIQESSNIKTVNNSYGRFSRRKIKKWIDFKDFKNS